MTSLYTFQWYCRYHVLTAACTHLVKDLKTTAGLRAQYSMNVIIESDQWRQRHGEREDKHLSQKRRGKQIFFCNYAVWYEMADSLCVSVSDRSKNTHTVWAVFSEHAPRQYECGIKTNKSEEMREQIFSPLDWSRSEECSSLSKSHTHIQSHLPVALS